MRTIVKKSWLKIPGGTETVPADLPRRAVYLDENIPCLYIGTNNAPVALGLKGEKGDSVTGPQGIAGTITVRNVYTGVPGSSVIIQNVGTAEEAVLDITIPSGTGFSWEGAYSAGTTYAINDVVSYNGSSYMCIAASTGNLPTNETYWTVMAQKGTDGTGSGDMVKATYDIVGDGVVNQARTVSDKAITLAKMADMATASLLGRKTAATGVPEVLSAADARTLLNVADGATANAAASTAETTTGTDSAKFVTPAGLAAYSKTIDPTITTTASSTGTITFLLSWLAKMVKEITGKTNWYDTPDISLATLKGQKVVFTLCVYPNIDLTSATLALPFGITCDTITIAGRTASNATKAPSSSTNAVLYKDGSSLDTRAFTVADTSFSSLSVSLAAGLYDLRLNQVAGYTGATDKVSVTFSGVRA